MSTIPPDDDADLTPIPPPEPPVPGVAAGAAAARGPRVQPQGAQDVEVGPVIAIRGCCARARRGRRLLHRQLEWRQQWPEDICRCTHDSAPASSRRQYRRRRRRPRWRLPGGAGGGSGTGATPGTGGGAGGGGGFGQGLIGTVSSVNGDTLTLTTRAGNVKVTITPSTTVTKSAPGAISDLTKGTNVRVTAAGSGSGGNSSGSSVTANSIAEVPADAATRRRGRRCGRRWLGQLAHPSPPATGRRLTPLRASLGERHTLDVVVACDPERVERHRHEVVLADTEQQIEQLLLRVAVGERCHVGSLTHKSSCNSSAARSKVASNGSQPRSSGPAATCAISTSVIPAARAITTCWPHS